MEASDSDVDTTFDDGASNDDDASSLHGPVVRRHRHSRQTSLSVPLGLPPAVAGPGRPLSGATGETKGSNGELSTLTKSTSQDTMATDRVRCGGHPESQAESTLRLTGSLPVMLGRVLVCTDVGGGRAGGHAQVALCELVHD